MKRKFMEAIYLVGLHGKILLKGFLRMMYGAMTAGLFVLAGYGFTAISSENGWTAVCEFVAAIATAVVGLACMYVQGGKCKKGGYER